MFKTFLTTIDFFKSHHYNVLYLKDSFQCFSDSEKITVCDKNNM
jgi:hypothetical protein